jgi:hypothetical protein
MLVEAAMCKREAGIPSGKPRIMLALLPGQAACPARRMLGQEGFESLWPSRAARSCQAR